MATRRARLRRAGLRLASLAVLGALVGCNSGRVEQPLTGTLGGSEPETQIEFWHALTERPLASHDEAFHAVLLMLDGADGSADYAGRVDALRGRGLLPEGFDRPADEGITRGVLAAVLARSLGIDGGVMMRLSGAHPRYADREMQYVGLYPRGSPNQTLSGIELVGILARAEDWKRDNPVDQPAEVLPPEQP